MKETAKQLGENKAALEAAQKKVDALAGGSGRQERASCGDVLTKVTLLIVIVGQNSASPQVKIISVEISSAGSVTCSADEIGKLKEQQAGLAASVASVAAAYETTVDEIMSKHIST